MDRIIDPEKQIAGRRNWVEGWNETMIKIWMKQINLLHVKDAEALYRSLEALDIVTDADGRFLSLELSHSFLEYGLWQDLGTGREFSIGNPGDLRFLDDNYRKEHKLDKPRKVGPKWGGGMTSGDPRGRRRWFSTKYYSSVMKLRDFMAESIGEEFVGMFANLDADDYRRKTNYYKSKGLS